MTDQTEAPRSWADHVRQGYPVPASLPDIHPGMRVCTMGSCFANEIRIGLKSRGIEVYPTSDQRNGELVWYTPVSLLQEARMAFGYVQRIPENIWSTPDGALWQDPYRRFVLADSETEIRQKAADQDRLLARSFEISDAFVFTLGLIEAWQILGGHWACHEPAKPRCGSAVFQVLTYETCLEAIRSLIQIIRLHRPGVSITLTVSPVPLFRTHRGIDVSIANSESKCILRAAAGKVCREDPSVHYFPAYEIVTEMGMAAYKEDRRHVRPEVVDRILNLFFKDSFSSNPIQKTEKLEPMADVTDRN